jgi:hypothetical protein
MAWSDSSRYWVVRSIAISCSNFAVKHGKTYKRVVGQESKGQRLSLLLPCGDCGAFLLCALVSIKSSYRRINDG